MKNTKHQHLKVKKPPQLISPIRIIISVGLMMTVFGVVLYSSIIKGQFPTDAFQSSYPIYRGATDHSFHLFIFAIPVGGIVILAQFWLWRRQLIVPIVLTVIVGFCIYRVMYNTFGNILKSMLGEQDHHVTLETDKYIYELSSEWKVGVGGASRAIYLVWRCEDQFSPCDIVASHRVPPIFRMDDYESTVADLQLDSQTGEILFLLDGEVIAVVTE